jgi:gluconokinase
MGVSGSGKTAVGSALAGLLGWEFHDADDLHSQANRNKMRNGIALTDSDRMPWLQRVRALIDQCLERGTDAILACSLLKQSYRDLVIPDSLHVRLIYLKGSPELIAERLARRTGHFMPPSLLASQLETLEEPRGALTIDISGTTVQVAEQVRTDLKL